MRSHSETLGLSGSAVPLLRDLVHERTGLFFDDGRRDVLAERLAPLVVERGFESFLDYYYLLKYDEESGATEWPKVMDALSVPETYFWREIDQIRAIVDVVVPSLVAALRGEPLKIWCVPCASGEEPLTIAMVLDQAGWFARAPIEIHASDGSPAQVARAREGRYRDRSFRALPLHLRSHYFSQNGDTWVPHASLRARISSWSVVNLMSPRDVAARATVPIIFCRNVFIYFSADRVREVVEQFAAAMPVPAYLCVAASESLLRVSSTFQLEEVGDAFVYVRR